MSISSDTDQSAAAIARAVDHLNAGGLVGFPTETVYGVAARFDSAAGVERLRKHAGLSDEHPLTYHVANADDAIRAIEQPSPALQRLIRKLFPGPVTLGVDQRGVRLTLRCPDHTLTQRWLAAVDGLVVGASATLAGARPALDADAARSALADRTDVVLDGGRCRFGKPSTLVHVVAGGNRLELSVKRTGVIDERMLRKMLKKNLLLVCTGNTCRSPMAEAIAKDLFKGEPEVTVGSAGVFAGAGSPATMEAVEAVKQLGLDLSGHRSRPLTPDLINAADYIFTMTESHRQAVLRQAPGAADKVQTLDETGDIADPIGGDLALYRDTAAQIRRALEHKLKEQLK